MDAGHDRRNRVSGEEQDMAISGSTKRCLISRSLKGDQSIGLKWVVLWKEAPSEQGEARYKARLVAKGYL